MAELGILMPIPSVPLWPTPDELHLHGFAMIRATVCSLICIAVVTQFAVAVGSHPQEQSPTEQFWSAARRGELEKVKSLIESGVDVDAKTNYGATALSFAADRGQKEVVEYLLSKGANPNVKDTFYNATPMTWATMHDRYDIMRALVLGGADDVDSATAKAIAKEDKELIQHVAENGKASRRGLMAAINTAKASDLGEIQQLLQKSLDKFYPKIEVPVEIMDSYAGTYLADDGDVLEISHKDQVLSIKLAAGGAYSLDADSQVNFSNPIAKLTFDVSGNEVTGFEWLIFGTKKKYRKLALAEIASLPKKEVENQDKQEGEMATAEFPASSPKSVAEDLALSGPNWSQFRGPGARGIADGQNPPKSWNAEKGENLAWKTAIPGLGHSCPVIWGDRLFVTTAISGKEAEIRTGLYGDVTSVEDDTEHEFVTYCLSAETGEILWQATACKRVPSVKRHLKSTHANSTVATNGQFVVSWFGSEGVYCYTMDGQLVWEKNLGLLDSGWFYDRDYQWQFGASPIIHSDRLILLCDIQDQSFIATYELSTGKELWRTERDEIPSWSTPTVVETPSGLQIVTNATGAAVGYDFETGEPLWQIKRNSEIAVPTPIAARGLLFISSGYRPIQPIYAIRLDARGDLTLDEGVENSEYVAWSETKGGPYMPSPIVYGDYLYVCSNSGILACYQAVTGKLVYKQRLPMKGNRSFVGSPVAADGHLYLTSEEGETAAIEAGPKFRLVSNNQCGENCLTTPAISKGTFYLRGQQHLFAFRAGE